MNRERFNELDVFRGIAALSVVLYHYFYRYQELFQHVDIPVAWARPGSYGVHFFFLISGFVIFWSLQRVSGVKHFMLSRFSRIFPAYWVSLIVIFLVVLAFGLPNREVDTQVLAWNFSMIQEYLNIPHVDQAYWTLTVELAFYFWITVLMVTTRLPHAEFWFLPFMLLGALYHLDIIHVPFRVNKILLTHYVNLFASGIVFYRIYTGTHTIHSWWFLALAAGVNFLIYPMQDSVMLTGFYVVFYLSVKGHLKFICVPPLVWLGGISYTLYLLHQNIGYVVIREVYELGGNGWMGISLALIIVVTLATMLSKWVERPASRWLRKNVTFNDK